DPLHHLVQTPRPALRIRPAHPRLLLMPRLTLKPGCSTSSIGLSLAGLILAYVNQSPNYSPFSLPGKINKTRCQFFVFTSAFDHKDFPGERAGVVQAGLETALYKQPICENTVCVDAVNIMIARRNLESNRVARFCACRDSEAVIVIHDKIITDSLADLCHEDTIPPTDIHFRAAVDSLLFFLRKLHNMMCSDAVI
ncbi:MAG: hypothetical protein ACREE4_20410, partial [Stellaceae bacterium]